MIANIVILISFLVHKIDILFANIDILKNNLVFLSR
jgi:hypothetical protein